MGLRALLEVVLLGLPPTLPSLAVVHLGAGEEARREQLDRLYLFPPGELLGCQVAFFDGGGVEKPELGEALLGVLQYIVGFMGREVSEEEVLIGGDEEVGGSDVAVVDIEVLVHCEGAEDHLVDKPNWVRRRYVSTTSSG